MSSAALIAEFQAFLETTKCKPSEIAARSAAIYEAVLEKSRHLDAGNFRSLHCDDLTQLFEEYDQRFFGGRCRQALGEAKLSFRLSPRMTSAGGKTTRITPRGRGTPRYEIAVSTTLLFQTFHDVEREVVVTGVVCHDRLQALQRVFEHELIHLIEMMAWNASNCSAARFQSIAARFFGHTDHRHQLITPKERAVVKYGLRPGSLVRFQMGGRHYEGILNRITKRATVLVEDPAGRLYNNGRRYAAYYVPLEKLTRVDAAG